MFLDTGTVYCNIQIQWSLLINISRPFPYSSCQFTLITFGYILVQYLIYNITVNLSKFYSNSLRFLRSPSWLQQSLRLSMYVATVERKNLHQNRNLAQCERPSAMTGTQNPQQLWVLPVQLLSSLLLEIFLPSYPLIWSCLGNVLITLWMR